MDVGGRSYPLPIYLRNERRVCGTLLRNRNSNTPNVIPACFKTRVTFHQKKKVCISSLPPRVTCQFTVPTDKKDKASHRGLNRTLCPYIISASHFKSRLFEQFCRFCRFIFLCYLLTSIKFLHRA